MGSDQNNSKPDCGTPVDALVAKRIGIPPSELTQENVEAYQLEAFRKLLVRVKYKSHYYRETLADFEPDMIRSMEDVKRLPFTTENDLAENEWRFQCVKASDVKRAVTIPTTGTRGMRKRLVFTAADQQKAIEFIRCGYQAMDCKAGERMLVFMSGRTPGSIGDLVWQAVGPLGMEIDVFGEVTDICAAYERLMEYRPAVVEAIPWHAAALAGYGQQFGNPEKDFIRSVNMSADVVPDGIADRLRHLWECTVHRHYGSTEMCIFGGVECKHQQGYHLRHSDILFEIPEPDENGIGEIVITTFAHEAMPLIRYRTGDVGRMTDFPCHCGAKVRRIEKIWGRNSSILYAEGIPFFLSDLADVLYAEDAVMDFGVVAGGQGEPMRVTVSVLPESGIDVSRIADRFAAMIRNRGGKGAAPVIWETAVFSRFSDGYNLKKTIQ